MKTRRGKIQIVVNKTTTVSEMNIPVNFTGVIKLCFEVWKAYKRKADKIYIFFSS